MNTGSQNKSKPISKQVKKKPYRPSFNNNTPYNKLSLNKFHQIQQPHQIKQKSDAFKLHKRKRDLERMLKHCQQKGIQIDIKKKQQLQGIQTQLNSRRKNYQKDKRKEFFLEQKYKDIKRIELRKVYKRLGEIKNDVNKNEEVKKEQLNQWEQKLRYIKNFPKNLKYISLFPSSKPLQQKTLQFQKKIMSDIQQQHKKRVSRLNFYKSQNETHHKSNQKQQNSSQTKKKSILPTTIKQFNSKEGKKVRKVVDDFFIQQEDDEDNEEIEKQDNDEGSDNQQNEDDSGMEIEDDQQSDEEEQDDQ